MTKTWFITGTSRGLGRMLSGAACEIVTGADANRLQVCAVWETVSRSAA